MERRSYCQLSLVERDQLAILRAQKLSLGAIAKRLGRSKSTLSRELRRNRALIYNAYGGGSAHRRALRRKCEAARRPRLKNRRIRLYVHRKIRLGWSPEQIAGRIAQELHRCCISYEAIYQYLYQPSVRRTQNLVPFLARAHRRRLPKGHRHTHRDPHIPERISIHRRPAYILKRRQLGHWESDSITARGSTAALNVLVERVSLFTKITRLPKFTARATRAAINRRLGHYPPRLRRTITYDNGKENVEHRSVNKTLGTRSFFCEPYHSWEKPLVENTNGLIRRVLPKKTKFDRVSPRDIKRLERRLNNRPRKTLNYRTPREVLGSTVALPH